MNNRSLPFIYIGNDPCLVGQVGQRCGIIRKGWLVQFENGETGFAQFHDLEKVHHGILYDYDHAMLRLAADIMFTNTGKPVCLTTANPAHYRE